MSIINLKHEKSVMLPPWLYIFLFLFSKSIFYGQRVFPDRGVVFNDEIISRIDIRINEDSLKTLLLPGNQNSDHEYPADFFWNDGIKKDTVLKVGFRLRGNTSRMSAKKSFKVKFNHFGSSKFHGLSDLNLNGEHNDPSIIRSKLCWDMMIMAGIEAPRSNHIALYINGQYMGLYINVEHIDNDYFEARGKDPDGQLFKCFYGSNFTYKGTNPSSYSKSVYQPENNENNPDYTNFIEFLRLLNDTSNPDYACNLEKKFDVHGYLQRMAMEILCGHWDNPIYNKNNAYLYFNPKSGKFELLSYDIDNTFGVDWFNINWATRNIYSWAHPTDPRPIYNNLLKVTEYKTIFGYYVKKYTDEIYNRNFIDSYIEKIKNKISPFRVNDIFASLDYGYTHADFLKSYETATGAHVKTGLKEFIGTRNSSVKSQLQSTDISPIVDHISTSWTNNYATLKFKFTSISQPQAKAFLKINNTNQQVTLKDDGTFPDAKAGDKIYTLGFAFDGKPLCSVYVEVTDLQSKTSRWPKCEQFTFTTGNNAVPKLIINEFMAENTTLPDNAGEFEDWIEIYNADNQPIWLGDKYLTDKALSPDKWKMPDITLSPGQFFLIWADEDQEQGNNHCNFKLSKSGEFIGIFDSKENNYAAIDSFSFGSTLTNKSYGRYPDGLGPVVPLSTATPNKSNIIASKIEEEFLSLRIYPLPAYDYVIIDGADFGDKIRITDIFGVTLAETSAQNNLITLDIDHLSTGLYILSLERGNKIYKRVFVVA